MTKIFFVADLHIGHKLVTQHRGILDANGEPDTGLHDRILADNWDSSVGSDDMVWVLGDISAGGKKAQACALEWLARRPGQKHLIAGNHDGPHPMHRDSHKWHTTYLETFHTIQSAARRRISGANFLLSHFPYNGDHGIDRYPEWRLRDTGTPIIHGHTHAQSRLTISARKTLQIHVGLDAWNLNPVSLQEIEKLSRMWDEVTGPRTEEHHYYTGEGA